MIPLRSGDGPAAKAPDCPIRATSKCYRHRLKTGEDVKSGCPEHEKEKNLKELENNDGRREENEQMNKIHRETTMVPWRKEWKTTFCAEKNNISEAMTAAGLEGNVYHIGSTSVKGMCSKPIIDILFCPAQGTSHEKCAAVLEGIGYTNLGECGRPGRLFLTKGDKENETFYLHLCDEDHRVARDQKLFRFIETHDETVFREYMQLKQQLAEMFPQDRDAYRTVKGRFVESVLSAYRLGEKSAADSVRAEDEQIRYWIFQFETTDELRDKIEACCRAHELTMDEFFRKALCCLNEWALSEPEGVKKAAEEIKDLKEEEADIRLIRYYPVYRWETEAQALKRKLAEEADAAAGREKTDADDEN